jgi:hypothetical protein
MLLLLTTSEEFHAFMKQTEKELWSLFESIDRNHDGTLDRDELRAAFQSAGLAVSSAKLDRFFAKVDANHDGSVSYEEWRYAASVCNHCLKKSHFHFTLHSLCRNAFANTAIETSSYSYPPTNLA